MPIILFVLLSMTTLSLFPAEKMFFAKIDILNAEYALTKAKAQERPEDEIKELKQAIDEAAQAMLFLLATFDEKHIRLSDIDFCLQREPALDDVLAVAASFGGITLIRELINRGADVGINDNAALRAAEIAKRHPIKELLLEAGNGIIE